VRLERNKVAAGKGRLSDLEVSGDLVDRLAFAEQLLALGQEWNDLFGGVAAAFHGVESSILTMLGNGLAQLVDQLAGIRSALPGQSTQIHIGSEISRSGRTREGTSPGLSIFEVHPPTNWDLELDVAI
jgi:hypothetical protein